MILFLQESHFTAHVQRVPLAGLSLTDVGQMHAVVREARSLGLQNLLYHIRPTHLAVGNVERRSRHLEVRLDEFVLFFVAGVHGRRHYFGLIE